MKCVSSPFLAREIERIPVVAVGCAPCACKQLNGKQEGAGRMKECYLNIWLGWFMLR